MRFWAASMMDFIPEAHTLLTVVAGVLRLKPGDTNRDKRNEIKTFLHT